MIFQVNSNFFLEVCRLKKIHVDIKEFKRLHAEGMTNKDIGNSLGFSQETARKIRCNLGLPSLARGRKPVVSPIIDNDELKKLYAKGLSDKQIGSVFGVSNKTILNHRKSLGLSRCKKWEDSASNIEKFKKLHSEGLNDRKIADVMGICRDTARKIRSDLGLPPQASGRKHVDIDKLKDLFAKGLTDKEIGTIFGVSAYIVYERRHDLGLFRRKQQIIPDEDEPIKLDSESLFCDTKFLESLVGKALKKKIVVLRHTLKKINVDELKQLFSEGLSDAEIGKVFGVCDRTISNRRRSLGLYKQKRMPRQNKRKDIDIDEFKQLYHSGMSDSMIGKVINISQSAVFRIRHHLGLAPNRGRRHWEMRELYDLKLSDGRVAEILKVRRHSVTTWRQSHELPANDSEDASMDGLEVEFLKSQGKKSIPKDSESLFDDTEFLEKYLGKNIKWKS